MEYQTLTEYAKNVEEDGQVEAQPAIALIAWIKTGVLHVTFRKDTLIRQVAIFINTMATANNLIPNNKGEKDNG